MLDLRRALANAPRTPGQAELRPLLPEWGERIAAGEESATPHPRPRFARASFEPLDGWWDFAVVSCEGAADAWRDARPPAEFSERIRVPFSPEAPLSGVGRQVGPDELAWYRRTFAAPEGKRVLLHFEAVDWACSCLVNGVRVGEHVGGYLPFSFDVTDALRDGENELALCAYDPGDEGVQPRGKQRRARGGIWYTAQSGIWQTVWLEAVGARRIASLAAEARPAEGRVVLTVQVEGAGPALPLSARVLDGGREVGRASAMASAGTHEFSVEVGVPRLWSLEDPHLYDLELSYGDDRVASYCAFRTVSVGEDARGVRRFFLNGEPLFVRGVLDQGYWPDGLMTAPSDEAMASDIRAMKRLGFNLLRKHLKVEAGRFYYHCDRLGMLVCQDMVSGGSVPSTWRTSYKPTLFRRSWDRFADDSPSHRAALGAGSAAFRDEWTRTCAGVVRLLRDHPSVAMWSLFNEGWGQFDARAAVKLVRGLDPLRPIDATSGWYDQRCGDFFSVHNYFRPLEVYRDKARPARAFLLSEFGGLSCHLPGHSSLPTSYGYESCADLASFRRAVRETLDRACALEGQGLAGFVYTQLSDVEEETNGLLTYDRRVCKLEEGKGA